MFDFLNLFPGFYAEKQEDLILCAWHIKNSLTCRPRSESSQLHSSISNIRVILCLYGSFMGWLMNIGAGHVVQKMPYYYMVNTLYALKGFYSVQLSAAGESTSISHTAFQVTSLGHQALHALTQERAGFGKQDEEVDREYQQLKRKERWS